MPDNRPEYDNYKRPSIGTCLVRIVLAYVFVVAVYAFFFLVFPQMRNALTYPVLAILLLILVVGGVWFLVTDRKRKQQHMAELEAQRKGRAVSDDWVAKELAESPYHSTEAAAPNPNPEAPAPAAPAADAPSADDTPKE
ncbi:MAG: hypothetical protein R2844_14935 [Caldilineales bacterium]